MIEQGQKLKEGDYCLNLNIDQVEEILKIEGDNYKWISVPDIFVYDGKALMINTCLDEAKTKYTFHDFRQLCINTFGDDK